MERRFSSLLWQVPQQRVWSQRKLLSALQWAGHLLPGPPPVWADPEIVGIMPSPGNGVPAEPLLACPELLPASLPSRTVRGPERCPRARSRDILRPPASELCRATSGNRPACACWTSGPGAGSGPELCGSAHAALRLAADHRQRVSSGPPARARCPATAHASFATVRSPPGTDR